MPTKSASKTLTRDSPWLGPAIPPGEMLLEEFLKPMGIGQVDAARRLGLSVTEAAKVLGVTRPALSALLNGRAALSPEMALRVEKAFGPKMDTLLRMQAAYEIARTRQREGSIKVKRYTPKSGPAGLASASRMIR